MFNLYSLFVVVQMSFCLIDDAKLRRFSPHSKLFREILLKCIRQRRRFATKRGNGPKSCRKTASSLYYNSSSALIKNRNLSLPKIGSNESDSTATGLLNKVDKWAVGMERFHIRTTLAIVVIRRKISHFMSDSRYLCPLF